MKIISVLVVLTLAGFSAFGGPEDHIADQTCYFPTAQSPAPTSTAIPLKVCLEKISVDLLNQTVSVYSYFNPELYDALDLTYLARHNENGYSFRAASVIGLENQGDCKMASTTTLLIAGRTDNEGAIAAQDLNITVEHVETSDTCHSPAVTTVYTYAK